MNWRTLLAAGIAAVAVVGCGGNDDHDSTQTFVQAIHASPDAPNVDVLADGAAVFTNVPFEAGASAEVDPGTAQITVRAAGTTTTVIDAPVDFPEDQVTTVIATGLLADIQPLIIRDSAVAPTGGQARLRVVHGSPSTGNVDVYISAPGTALADAPVKLLNVPFRGASDALEVAQGTYQVRITPAGNPGVLAFDANVTLGDDSNFTAVAVDAPGGGGFGTVRVYEVEL